MRKNSLLISKKKREKFRERDRMEECRFMDMDGSFEVRGAGHHTGLYFPLASECGLKSAVTPELGGDAKTDQNHFLLEPVSVENLHDTRSSRNFWCAIRGKGIWSVTGASSGQRALAFTSGEEEVTVQAGYMWHKVKRNSHAYGISGEITSYIPVQKNVEIHLVRVENTGEEPLCITPIAAVPIYGRSADNIRDHRHVTSLLHRITVTERGVQVFPTMSFDERGHKINTVRYFVEGMTGDGQLPESFYPERAAFIGEGGNFENPEAVVRLKEGVKAGYCAGGQEALGGLRFAQVTLTPGESRSYILFVGLCHEETDIRQMLEEYKAEADVLADLDITKQYWRKKVNVACHTKDTQFDSFMRWVCFQPELRRLYGCSFLPHHDYGKGGRGWRDLWQDCLALLLMNPGGVRQMLLGNFAGVRMDGTNATIIGEHLGEFKADRNAITRVWMDHGVWPLMTTKLYIDQTGDSDILNQEVCYFKDRQIERGTAADELWKPGELWQMDVRDRIYRGTVLEHLLLQNLTAFWEVGGHNHIRLRDADWNDALDMAGDKGESVAFSSAYAKNLLDLADLIEERMHRGQQEFELLQELEILLRDEEILYEDTEKKRAVLEAYTDTCRHTVSGIRIYIEGSRLIHSLRSKGAWMQRHIRQTEWVTDQKGNGWFNGYYDNHGRRVEGETDGLVRMMLTSQVFAIMGGTATDEQTRQIAKSAERYLFDEACGGYRLNTDFHEVKLDMGRMFGFAYGEKENGAVFSHMAVMYANALYQRGLVKEGFSSLNSLYRQAMRFEKSHIYPGIPEYFGKGGRGLYHYLTGAGSWYMLTVVNQMFGVRGEWGDLVIEPRLLLEQFDSEGKVCLSLKFAGQSWLIEMSNPGHMEYGQYEVKEAAADDGCIPAISDGRARISLENIRKLDARKPHKVRIILGKKEDVRL